MLIRCPLLMEETMKVRLSVLLAAAGLFLPSVLAAQSRNAEEYLFLARKAAKVSKNSLVSGYMGVNAPGGLLNLSQGATMANGTLVCADRVDMRRGSRAFNVFAN